MSWFRLIPSQKELYTTRERVIVGSGILYSYFSLEQIGLIITYINYINTIVYCPQWFLYTKQNESKY